jgi:hypothetical protein
MEQTLLFRPVEIVSEDKGVARMGFQDRLSNMNCKLKSPPQRGHSSIARVLAGLFRPGRRRAGHSRSLGLWRVATVILLSGVAAASDFSTSTNWEGLTVELDLPKTNFAAGEQILASIIVSNSVLSECVVTSLDRDPCRAGFGEFLIIELRSGKRVHCTVPMNQRIHGEEKQHSLVWHEAKEFAAELAGGYAITNTGAYTIQALARFRFLGKAEKHCDAVTPPITLWFSRGNESPAPVSTPEPATPSATNPPPSH